MAAVETPLSLRGGSRVRRRRVVNRLAEAAATLGALAAVAVLGVVVWSIAKRGASCPGASSPTTSRSRSAAGAAGLHRCSSGPGSWSASRRRWRSRSAC